MTQKATHEFNMESLSEDHQCLMDIADQLKSDLAAAKSEASTAQAEKRALKHDLEALETQWQEEKEREKQREPNAASPNRVIVLEQVFRWD